MPVPVVVLIAGPSCSGKTTVSHLVAANSGVTAEVLSLDSFYADLGHLPPDQRALSNFDHPDALDWPLLRRTLRQLSSGQTAEAPDYCFREHCRRSSGRPIDPPQLLIVEGIHALHDPGVRELSRLRVYVEVSPESALSRRIGRDTRERGRTVENVVSQFETTVLPMWREFVEPSSVHAHLIIQEKDDNYEAAYRILQRAGFAIPHPAG